MLRSLVFAATVFTALPAFADSVTDTVLAFDRQAGVIVLADKSVFSLTASDAMEPEGLLAGDTVTITYDSLGEDGYGVIKTIVIDG